MGFPMFAPLFSPPSNCGSWGPYHRRMKPWNLSWGPSFPTVTGQSG
jgi:hypothetical protein